MLWKILARGLDDLGWTTYATVKLDPLHRVGKEGPISHVSLAMTSPDEVPSAPPIKSIQTTNMRWSAK